MAHPDSPAGGGGPGHFAPVALPTDDSDLPNPRQPGPAKPTPLQGKPTPPKRNPPPSVQPESFELLRKQDASYDVLIEGEILADAGSSLSFTAHTQVTDGTTYAAPEGQTSNDKIVGFTSKFVWKGKYTIQTGYAAGSGPRDDSCYGRGTTTADVAAGDITLGFHESCHREDYKSHLKTKPLPKLPKYHKGMSIDEYNAATEKFDAALKAYLAAMTSASIEKTDNVGYTESTWHSSGKCYKHLVP